MPRRIKEPAAVIGEVAAQTAAAPAEGHVTFIKNQVNQKIEFPDGTTHQFAQSCETYSDPELISKIRSVATRYKIHEKK